MKSICITIHNIIQFIGIISSFETDCQNGSSYDIIRNGGGQRYYQSSYLFFSCIFLYGKYGECSERSLFAQVSYSEEIILC